MSTHERERSNAAFTLIELSIVLVIIGLIVGGVLVGQELVRAAEIRSQISQIEKFNIAVQAFRGKYSCIPGDCVNAANFGFAARDSNRAGGNGDGNIEGEWGGNNPRMLVQGGETALFWRDLSDANLISNKFSTGLANTALLAGPVNEGTSPATQDFMPRAVLSGHWIYVYSNITSGTWQNTGEGNYFALTGLVDLFPNGTPNNITRMSPNTAYSIDIKTDDGAPQAGRVLARLNMNNDVQWVAGGTAAVGASPGVATPASSTTCYDNGNNAAANMIYSTGFERGNNLNCALSIKFQ